MSTATQLDMTTAPRIGRSPALWAGVVGAPAVWAVQMTTGYTLAPLGCGSNTVHLILHGVTILCALLALFGGYLSWREYHGAGGGSHEDTAGGIVDRARVIGALGLAVSLLMTLVILAQGIPSFFFDGCWI